MSTHQQFTAPLSRLIPFTLGNSRRRRNPAKFAELKASVAHQGVLQPILVRPAQSPDNDGLYEVVAGFGRWEAAVELALPDVPVMCRVMTDHEALEAQIVENANREDISLVQEAQVAQRYVGHYEGDREAARVRLGWTRRRLDERLELMKAVTPVLDALEAEEIKPQHAIILASLPEKLQLGTLPKIIAEGWSVETLKERAGRAQRPLASAFFDIGGCSGCPHNTQAQAGLFDAISAEAMCSDAACYRKKTDDAVAARRAELEETYGKVILLSEVADDQRSTVSAAVVGDTQFTQCQQCQSRAVVMDNRAGREGQVTENQCLDKACFTKCAKAMSTAATKAAAKAPDATPTATKTAPTGSAASATKTATKPAAAAEKPVAPAKVSATLVEMYRQILRDTAAKHLLTIPSYRPALVIASLSQTMQCEVEPLASRSATFGLADKIKVLMGHDLPTLQTLLNEAVTHLSTTVATPTGSHIGHMIDVLIAVFKVQPEAVALATAAWKPTNEILSQYTKDGLVALLNDAGFAAAYDAAKGTASFAKLQNGDKKSFVKAVMAFTEFDWSPYAPEAGYLASLR